MLLLIAEEAMGEKGTNGDFMIGVIATHSAYQELNAKLLSGTQQLMLCHSECQLALVSP